jgi:hypothetical protein
MRGFERMIVAGRDRAKLTPVQAVIKTCSPPVPAAHGKELFPKPMKKETY